MFRWIPFTFVRTVVFFVGGIVLAMTFPDVPQAPLWVGVVALACSYFLVVAARRRGRRLMNPGLIALSLFFLLGYVHMVRSVAGRDPSHLLHHAEGVTAYRAVVTRWAEERTRSWRLEACIIAAYNGAWKPVSGKVLLYCDKKDFPLPFLYGDVVLVRGAPQRVPGPANPEEFDYRQFLARQQIHYQHFLRGTTAVVTGSSPPNPVMLHASRVRAWAEATLKRFVTGHAEQAIARALVLGITDGLDNELRQAYAAAGAMHVLAVSGLHVGILYVILSLLMRPLRHGRGGKWFVALISLGVLWLYAMVTGLSPSVLRAVTMFSFVAIARPWARTTNIYNTLAVSVFFLLLADPAMLLAVGFQLSYLAVLGIVYFYPRLVTLWEPTGWLGAEVWKLACVSVAAQAATFPLGLLYFHQFPNYFLLANLLVVPLSFAVLVGGLVVLALSVWTPAAALAGWCLEWLVRILNASVAAFERMPFSLTDNIYISGWQCALLLTLLFALILLAEFRKFSFALIAACLVAAFVALQWHHIATDVAVDKVIVYSVPGHTAIDFAGHGRTFFSADETLQRDIHRLRYHVFPARVRAGVTRVVHGAPFQADFSGCRVMVWKGRTFLLVHTRGARIPGPVKVDVLIIANNAAGAMDKIAGNVTFKTMVLDSSNSRTFASRLAAEARQHQVEVHSVLHQGAFVYKPEIQDP